MCVLCVGVYACVVCAGLVPRSLGNEARCVHARVLASVYLCVYPCVCVCACMRVCMCVLCVRMWGETRLMRRHVWTVYRPLCVCVGQQLMNGNCVAEHFT